ncbi:SusC/RagA family TonB-linked outer membrane protein [Pedobacter hiemivivus]|uniref:SusC/RagA family TonB-linked outer membrane protein n=2 Tax=Pedobacter hiemivivus TaxID=2530454 RepID=A0A4R0N5Q9_9SPHI|nr:SusC/RagA family TonB-linked outer membrane protein [Pedobacter hiemivivus]
MVCNTCGDNLTKQMYEFKSPFNGNYVHRIFKFRAVNQTNPGALIALEKYSASSVKPLLMRITLIFLFVTFTLLNVSAGLLHAQKISLHKVNVPLYEVINEIRNQTGYDFFMNMDLLKNAKPVTISMDNETLETVLAKCFDSQSLTYEIKDNKTVIVKSREIGVIDKVIALFEIRRTSTAQQQIVARGLVTDSLNKPIAGVSVAVKGKKATVFTKANGTFEIILPKPESVLTFSYIGMEPQDHSIKNPAQLIRIVLKPQARDLDNVVITGYSNIKKDSFTGNSINVTKEQLLQVGNRNVVDILQVFDPSFRVQINNLRGSDPNTMPEFYVRGRSGIGVKELDKGADLSQAALTNNPNLPIFIMDGYEVSAQRVYDFDINQIKSITILKDAAATAVYGSRAANGVIVIETVPPIPGKLRIGYNFVGTVTAPDLSDYNLMNAAQKLEAEILAGSYVIKSNLPAQNALLLTDELLRKQSQVLRGVNSDWISQPLTNEFNQKHTLNIDGGTDQVRFGVALRMDQQNGVMKQSARKRAGAGLSLEYRLKNLSVRNDINYDVVDSKNSPYGSFGDYTWKAPYDEIYDVNAVVQKNTFGWHGGATDMLNLINPLYEARNTQNYSIGNTTTMSNNLSLNWTVLDGLQIRGTLSLTKAENSNENFIDPASGRYYIDGKTDYTTIGSLDLRSGSSLGINANAFANYVKSIDNHNINLSLGVNAIENSAKSNSSRYTGFASGSQHAPNLASKIADKPFYGESKSRLFGTFLTMNYSFKDIYLFDVSTRLDGSSEFGSKSKFAPFWSLGAGLNLHKYDFVKDIPVISRARITANTGQLGKTNFPPFATKDNYSISNNWYSTGPGVSLYYMGNPTLSWEKTRTLDVIFDLGLFRDRLTFNFNYYTKNTQDLVTDINLPLSSGFPQYKGNIGEVENKGYEFRLRYDVIRQKDFTLAVYGNFASNTNKLTGISKALKAYNDLVDKEYEGYNPATGANSIPKQTKYSTPHIKYVEGGSLTSLFGMKSLGINPMDGQEIFLRKDGTITTEWNAADQVIIGELSPKGQGAFGINAGYKNITLFASFMYEYGRDEYNSTLLNKVENVDIYNRNADLRFLNDRWKQPGDIASFKNIADIAWTTRPTSRFIQRANSISLNSLSVGYMLDQKALKKLGRINMARIQVNTNNVFKISTVKQERGLEYPYARTFDLSLNLGF